MENVKLPPEIINIYDDYLNDTIELEVNRKATDGLLGFGKTPGSDPCHNRFAVRLEEALDSIAASEPSSEVAFEILRFVFDAPLRHENNKLAFWMLEAVHGLTDGLIRFLSPEDAGKLSEWYAEVYPKHVRLPVQKAVAEHLRVQANGDLPQKRKSALDFIIGRFGNRF